MVKVTKEQILQKALTFFTTNDYDRASLNEIAKALDITKGGIYHYFGSKDDLFYETVIYVLDVMENQMIDAMDIDYKLKDIIEPLFMLDNVAEYYSNTVGVDLLGEYSNFIYLLFSSMKKFSGIKSKISRVYTRFMVSIEMLFREAQKRGEIRSELDPVGLAFEVTAFIEGGMLITAVSEGFDGNKNGSLVFKNFWNRITKEKSD